MNENEVLRQRIKELNGLISLMEIANKTEDLREVINKLTSNIIPKSMKFSDKVFSLVIIDNVENSNCKNISKKTSNYLKADIKTKKEKYGELQVGYIDENLKFIDEFEQKIVNAYAIALSKLIENLKYQEKIIKEKEKAQELELKFKSLFNNNNDAIFVSEFNNGKFGNLIEVNETAC